VTNLSTMICLKVDIPEELSAIDDECKAIYHSKDSICFFLFNTRELRNAFVEETKGMMKAERMEVYNRYQQMEA
jgi:hypothetical protein